MSNLEKFVAAGAINADTVTEQEKAVIQKLSPEEGEAMLRLRRSRNTDLIARESGNIIGPFAGQ